MTTSLDSDLSIVRNKQLSHLWIMLPNLSIEGAIIIVIFLFIDLKKEFDTVHHRILLRKLYAYGIRGILLKWFESYLTDRSQYVIYDGVESEIRPVECGVPQGSISRTSFIYYLFE